MLKPRRPLGEINSNIRRGKNLSSTQRDSIVAAFDAGLSKLEISGRYDISFNTVKKAIQRSRVQVDATATPRRGRPQSYSDRDERRLLRTIKTSPKTPYRILKRQTNIKLSTSTIQRILKKYNIKKYPTRSRPFLTKQHAQKRRAWCTERKD